MVLLIFIFNGDGIGIGQRAVSSAHEAIGADFKIKILKLNLKI